MLTLLHELLTTRIKTSGGWRDFNM